MKEEFLNLKLCTLTNKNKHLWLFRYYYLCLQQPLQKYTSVTDVWNITISIHLYNAGYNLSFCRTRFISLIFGQTVIQHYCFNFHFIHWLIREWTMFQIFICCHLHLSSWMSLPYFLLIFILGGVFVLFCLFLIDLWGLFIYWGS